MSGGKASHFESVEHNSNLDGILFQVNSESEIVCFEAHSWLTEGQPTVRFSCSCGMKLFLLPWGVLNISAEFLPFVSDYGILCFAISYTNSKIFKQWSFQSFIDRKSKATVCLWSIHFIAIHACLNVRHSKQDFIFQYFHCCAKLGIHPFLSAFNAHHTCNPLVI